ncbi:hypothetical protein [Micromonospora palomenae]|uniref:hypothetical protein n=1 Tax=Micromonospora palomenae TaxID=1461247 RepID=UPI003F8C6CE3
MEDADEAVAELAQCGVVADAAGALLVVVGAGVRRGDEGGEGLLGESVESRSLCA